jgi:hypothetical protein
MSFFLGDATLIPPICIFYPGHALTLELHGNVTDTGGLWNSQYDTPRDEIQVRKLARRRLIEDQLDVHLDFHASLQSSQAFL